LLGSNPDIPQKSSIHKWPTHSKLPKNIHRTSLYIHVSIQYKFMTVYLYPYLNPEEYYNLNPGGKFGSYVFFP
jgi:hypothetical protein